jgi:vacuolar-type H+-ATPase subunit F/Vma7
MKGIALVADRQTVNCFKLAGLDNAYSVKSAEEAEKRIHELLKIPDLAIIIITDHIANRIHDMVNKITEEYEYPLIISIPTVGGPSLVLLDSITEFIKRKTGIELKITSDSKES